MPKYKVMVARFPYLRIDEPDGTDWLASTILKMHKDPRISEIVRFKAMDTPIPMCRNRCLREALERGVDYLLMLDNDMSPDLPLPGAKPFWDSSWDKMLSLGEPALIAAPYCGPPPIENVYIFRWTSNRNGVPDGDFHLEQYGREEASRLVGFEAVAALPTGLILIDMRAIAAIKPPWFYYEYTDHFESQKASTEDVTFTRDLSLAGIPIYVNWDAWAGHWKELMVGKPSPMTVDTVKQKFVECLQRGYKSGERTTIVGEGREMVREVHEHAQHVLQTLRDGTP